MIAATPVILCGGSGTRLWPLSRSGFPKQFLCLTGNESLFQQAIARMHAIAGEDIDISAPLVLSSEAHRFLALEQLREAKVDDAYALILEPVGRGTAPALTLAALAATGNGEDPVLVVTPSDQAIADSSAYVFAMRQAIRQAAKGGIVILGIPPKCPETGYGYIKGRADPSTALLQVERFVEKPNLEKARQYFEEGGYYWNSGMFVLKASVWLEAVRHFRPDIADKARIAWDKRGTDAGFVRPGEMEFRLVPDESIDCAVMERCPHPAFPVHMAQLDAGWSDLGAWSAVWDLLPKDEADNACRGDIMTKQCRGTLAYATSRLVGLVGVENLIVIETPDAVLVADKAHSQEVKQIVGDLDRQKREEHRLHRKVHRPWGWYDSMDAGDRFQVKRILVKPKASLSLQRHHHRSEHWIVVRGTAEITCGDKVSILAENQSAYIPLGEPHRLANPGMIPLEIIEVQSGSYLGEDDIVRLEDHYGRK